VSAATAADLLALAADAITPTSWCQHDMTDGMGRFCATAHLRLARDRLSLPVPDVMRAYEDALIHLELTDCRPTVPDWNDTHGRTAEQVRDVFLKAAAALRREARLGL
jgi:hypothetical protein